MASFDLHSGAASPDSRPPATTIVAEIATARLNASQKEAFLLSIEALQGETKVTQELESCGGYRRIEPGRWTNRGKRTIFACNPPGW